MKKTIAIVALGSVLVLSAQGIGRADPLSFLPSDTIGKNGVDLSQNSYTASGTLDHFYGPNVLMASWRGVLIAPSPPPSWAEWSAFGIPKGQYCVSVTYAALLSRPLSLSIDGTIRLRGIASQATGGWDTRNPKVVKTVTMSQPITLLTNNSIRLSADTYISEPWPHFIQMVLTPANSGLCTGR
jgi:hypothetical protein